MPVPEIAWLDALHRLAEQYETTFGTRPLDLSHWDPSEEWKARMASVQIDTTDVIEYIFSELLDVHSLLRRKLGVDAGGKSSFLCNNGTTGIACVLNYLRRTGHEKLHVISPSYFALDHQAAVLGIGLERSFLHRQEGRYSLSAKMPQLKPGSVLWITNPVFCTSGYYGNDDLQALDDLLEAGVWVVADECLAMHGREVGRVLGHHERFLGIYTPHKSICINGMKFALVVGPAAAHAAFQEWADVFAGGLAISTILAVKHYLSAPYDRYQQQVRQALGLSLTCIHDIIHRFPGVEFDAAVDGHLIMCFLPWIDAAMGQRPEFLWEAISGSGSIFYPGIRNHFDPRWGLCFRLNLARHSRRFETALYRLLSVLRDTRG